MPKAKHALAGLKIAVAVLALVAAASLGFGIYQGIRASQEPRVDSSYVTGKLQNLSELSTQQLTYTGVDHVVDGEIPIIDKKSFNMVYTATARAGIELSDVEVDVTDSQVKVTVPHAQLQSVQIDPGSIKFYDQSFALFSRDGKEQLAEAVAKAEDNFKNEADYQSLLDAADTQTAAIVKGILEGQVGDREVEIAYK